MKKDTKLIIGIALIFALVGFYLYSKKATTSTETKAAGPPMDATDEANFKKLVSTFKSKCDPKALDWMLPLVKELTDGFGTLKPENLINGKVTKAGAFSQVYGESYWPPQYGYRTTADAGEVISRMFQQMKNQAELGVS